MQQSLHNACLYWFIAVSIFFYRTALENNLKSLVTKEDLIREISKVREEISASKADMVKWFVALFFGLAIMIIGLYFRK